MSNEDAKFIIYESGFVVVWSTREGSLAHAAMDSRVGQDRDSPVSAGFIAYGDDGPHAHGYSHSMGRLKSRPEDSEIIAKYLGMTIWLNGGGR